MFSRLWDNKREGWARRFFERWKSALRWQRLKPDEKFARMVEAHRDGIQPAAPPFLTIFAPTDHDEGRPIGRHRSPDIGRRSFAWCATDFLDRAAAEPPARPRRETNPMGFAQRMPFAQ